jgi:hypothetical protein
VQDVRPGRREISSGSLENCRVIIHVEDAEALAPLDGLEVRLLKNDDQTLLLVLDVVRRHVLRRKVNLFHRFCWYFSILKKTLIVSHLKILQLNDKIYKTYLAVCTIGILFFDPVKTSHFW